MIKIYIPIKNYGSISMCFRTTQFISWISMQGRAWQIPNSISPHKSFQEI